MPKWPFVCARLKSESLMWFNCRRCEFGPGLALPSGTWGMVYFGMVWYTAYVSRTTCPPPGVPERGTSFLESRAEMIYNQKRIYSARFSLWQPAHSHKSWHFIDAHKLRRLAAIKPTRPQGHGRTSVICLQRLAQSNREQGKFVSGGPGNRGSCSFHRQAAEAKRQKLHWIYVAAIYDDSHGFAQCYGYFLPLDPWSRSESRFLWPAVS